jgi:hypothetical protein
MRLSVTDEKKGKLVLELELGRLFGLNAED